MMNRFFKIVLTLLFFVVSLGISAKNLKKSEILNNRVKSELSDYSYKKRVAKSEVKVALEQYKKELAKEAKLRILHKTESNLGSECFFLDFSCHFFYAKTTIYLKDELKTQNIRLKKARDHFKDTSKRYDFIVEREEALKKGIFKEEKKDRTLYAFPELKKAFKCRRKRNWNTKRGIFLDPSEIEDLPFSFFVKDVVKIDDYYTIVLSANKLTIVFSYVKKALVKKGEIVNVGQKILSGSSSNPIVKGTVLMATLKSDKFVNPMIMCK